MYARGILFGKMVLELGDTCIAKNEKHGLYCDLEFKTKVRWFIFKFHMVLNYVSHRRASFLEHITHWRAGLGKVQLKSVKYRGDGAISWTSRTTMYEVVRLTGIIS